MTLTGLFTVAYCKIPELVAAGCLCWGVLLAACEQPEAAVSSQALATQERLLLTQADQTEILAALRSITQDRSLVNRPRPAPGGLRWSDVEQAVAGAVGEVGVEMAIVNTVRHDDGYTFQLKTVEDRPAELIVRRRPDQRVYDATATVGRFADDHQRAEALLVAFDRMMRAFGRKRGFNDEDP